MAEESVGLENQETPPAQESSASIIIGKPPEIARAKESNGGLGLIVGLEKDPDVIEHVDKSKVEAMVKKIGEFYDVPQRAIEQGLNSEVYVMNNDGFKRYAGSHFEQLMRKEGKGEIEEIPKDDKLAEIIYSAFGSSIEKENRNRAIMNELIIQKAREHAEKTGGLTIPLSKGRSIILIREGNNRGGIEIHELMHAISMAENGKEGGFRSSGRTLRKNIDEAATETLALVFQHPELTLKELIDREIKTAYYPFVRKLLVAMYTTNQSEKPFTFKELAKYYFCQEPGMGIYLLQMNLIPRAREDVRGQVGDWFKNDFKEETQLAQ